MSSGSVNSRICGPRKAFTLVELLVVIAIISILAGMLLPALENALNNARSIVCVNNFKQLYLITNEYAEDYDDYIFSSRCQIPGQNSVKNWNYNLYVLGYIGDYSDSGILACPVGSEDGTSWLYHYGANQRICLKENSMRRSEVSNPDGKLLLLDARFYYITDRTTHFPTYCTYRHNNGFNALFVGGSARWLQDVPNEAAGSTSAERIAWWFP
ncbi:MAG: type II secretion system protein [Planctomycetota bacterium]|jgi:prepilin-type N-terminal cleavage/methylation domain-containing protein/prepilin-type processing-associated H-X9-DG protein